MPTRSAHGLTVVWSPAYEVDIGRHVFPTAKYRLIRNRLREAGIVPEEAFVQPEPATRAQLERVHTPEYLRKIDENDFTTIERWTLEVPFSEPLREASILCCGGTLLAARRAIAGGVAVHLGGGFHHAFADHGEGFCLLNDVAVAAATVLEEDGLDRVAIVDLDVHHGNGTAAIFAEEPRVFTFSMHQEANYPASKPPSDLDVGLPDRTTDAEYLALLDDNLNRLLERHEPQLVFYLAGADPYEGDQLGGLALTMEGLRERDAMVLHACGARDAAVAITLAGGYAMRQSDTVEIHVRTVGEAVRASLSTAR